MKILTAVFLTLVWTAIVSANDWGMEFYLTLNRQYSVAKPEFQFIDHSYYRNAGKIRPDKSTIGLEVLWGQWNWHSFGGIEIDKRSGQYRQDEVFVLPPELGIPPLHNVRTQRHETVDILGNLYIPIFHKRHYRLSPGVGVGIGLYTFTDSTTVDLYTGGKDGFKTTTNGPTLVLKASLMNELRFGPLQVFVKPGFRNGFEWQFGIGVGFNQ